MSHFRLALATFAALLAVPSAPAQPSFITGRVYDSLRMVPLAGATVHLSGTQLESRTGADGTYRLTTELKGRRTLTLAEPRLDRLLGTVTTEIELQPGTTVRFDIAIPRLPPPPAILCPPGPVSAGGAALGVLRDSTTRLPISGAEVVAFWVPTAPDTAARRGVRAESGEDGGFLLCGLPTDRPISLVARSPGRASARDGLRLSVDSILDLDLLGQGIADGALLGRLGGRVVDSASGQGLAGADVMLIGSGLHATSGSDGQFGIDQVVAGQISLVARRIGYRPNLLNAVVPESGTATVVAVLSPAPFQLEELEAKVAAIDREFEERKKQGMGKFWVESEIRRFDGGSITSLLRGKASVREDRGTLINYSRGRRCTIPVIVDGAMFPTLAVRPEQLARAEFYSGPAQVPIDFQEFHLRANGFRCGLLVLWTRGRG